VTPLGATAGEHGASELVGHFRVERTAGFLPPLHFTKRIGVNRRGVTAVLGLPLFPFHVEGTAATPEAAVLRYVALPVRDELVHTSNGWEGRGLVFGLEFCRFRLLPSA
jgi:hypothetical protein